MTFAFFAMVAAGLLLTLGRVVSITAASGPTVLAAQSIPAEKAQDTPTQVDEAPREETETPPLTASVEAPARPPADAPLVEIGRLPAPPANAPPGQPDVSATKPQPTPPRPAPAPAAKPASSSEGPDSWEGRVLAALNRHRRYPAAARARRQQGVPWIRFTIDRQGHVRDVRLERTSGVDSLDREALSLPRRAQPLPAPPDDRKGDAIELVVPVEYFMDR